MHYSIPPAAWRVLLSLALCRLSLPPADACGCRCPHGRAGNSPLRSSAWKARQCCQLLPSCAVPFWPALVFMGLSHETCSSIKGQKTIIFKNWLNSLPFKCVKLPCCGDQKMLRPAKGKEEKSSSLCLSARSSVWIHSPQCGAPGSSAGARKAALILLGRSLDFANCDTAASATAAKQLGWFQRESAWKFVSSPGHLGGRRALLCAAAV